MGKLLATLVACAACLAAQDATGKIYGTVTDPTGAVITGAKVTVTNTATGVGREIVTDAAGYYQVTALPLGTYRVTVEQPGFKKVVSADNTLRINESLKIDLSMQVGATAEIVEVTAVASTVETAIATLGASVTSRPILNLPLNGRNVLSLALLQPGVTPTRYNVNGVAFSVAGGKNDSITFLLDGGLNNNLLNNGIVYNPNPDAIEEFRILTSNYGAEYGRNGNGIVSMVTKSGSNNYHGSLYEFLRNDAFNANLFFNNANGTPRPVLKRNQFGATFGGPVTIPKLVRGTDRFFFFANWQSQRLTALTQNPAVTVFTPQELAGDFSRSNATRNGPDANVADFLAKFPFFQPDPAKAAQAIIDPSRISTVARNYITHNLIPTSTSGRLFPQGGEKNDNDELTNKVDFLITQSDRLSVTLGASRNPRLSPFSAESNVPGYPVSHNTHRYFGNAAYTKIFRPTLLNELRVTAQRNNGLQFVPASDLPKPNELGIDIISDHPTGPTLLRFASGMRTGFSRNGPTTLIDNTYAISDNLTWIAGRHTWKWGFLWSPYQNNTVYDFYINGRFQFDGRSGRGSKNDRADFILGLPDRYLQFPEAPSNIRSRSYAAFAQDEWHVTRRLVLTLGLRYEYNEPKFDQQGRSFSVIYGQKSQRFTKAPLGLVFPGDRGAPKGANFPDRNDFAPRFGFAWDPRGNGRTSIRGGFGVFYDVLKAEDNLQFNGQAPFFGFNSFRIPGLAANPAAEPANMSHPYQTARVVNTFPSRPPARDLDFDAAGFLPIGDAGVYFVDPHLRTPYTYQFNLSLQHELASRLVGELSYVGNSAHKMTALFDSNPYLPGTTTQLFDTQPGGEAGNFSFLDTFGNVVNSHYHSLQASLQKQLSDSKLGTSYFILSYTYGHTIDNATGFRENSFRVPTYNWFQFRASGDNDIRHRISFGGGWDLPFDRAWSGGPKRLTRGWSLYPILSWRTGLPLDIYAGLPRGGDPGPSGAGDPDLVRANLVGSSIAAFDPHKTQTFSNKSGNYYFDPANFSTDLYFSKDFDPVKNPAQRTYGTLGRNAFYGPGRTNLDVAMAKMTPLYGERLKAEFRAEFFNVFNHAQFGEPDTGITSGTFGQVTTTADPRIIQFGLRVTF